MWINKRGPPRGTFGKASKGLRITDDIVTLFVPFLPMGRIDLNSPPRLCIYPRSVAKSAWERQCVHLFLLQNGEPQVAVIRNLCKRADSIPHGSYFLWRNRKASIDFPQTCSTVFLGGRAEGSGLDRFIRRENVKHYRLLLAQITDEAERRRIEKLLAEEIKKQRDAGDKIEE